MNTATLDIIVSELAGTLTGRRFGRVFQLGRFEFAFDFRLSDSRYLFIDAGAADPKLFLVRRRLKDLERSSGKMSPFALQLRKRLSGAALASVDRAPQDRVVSFAFEGEDETGASQALTLLAQLTGKSANLFLIRGDDGVILDRVRETLGDGQMIGEKYCAPGKMNAAARPERLGSADQVVQISPDSPSEALDTFYAEQAAKRVFDERANAAIRKTAAELRRREKLIQKLNDDLARHGEANEWKHLGDVLLANVSTAKRVDGAFVVTDYFDETIPEISIPADENQSVTEAAESYFRRYTKARNAVGEITGRLAELTKEAEELKRKLEELEEAKSTGDASAFGTYEGEQQRTNRPAAAEKRSDISATARSFRSSDGFEILVGKKAKDNDVLTFKMAKSLDTWMHAADYPGSHVVIRNPNRVEIPPRTLLEAAQLAAFYSQGKSQPKAAVNYTQKKFVNKPKGAPPGLVSLSSFKTILVEPGVPEALEKE